MSGEARRCDECGGKGYVTAMFSFGPTRCECWACCGTGVEASA